MIDHLSSYSVKNFIPFIDEVYFRLFERHFEKWWPAHPFMLALGIAIIVLAWMGKTRVLAVALTVPLIFCAVTFHFLLYAELTLLGKYFGWAFLLQAALLLLWGFSAKPSGKGKLSVSSLLGSAIAVFGIAVYPFLVLSEEGTLKGAQYLGMSPDPTICFVLGILLMAARPVWFLLLYSIPFLWVAATAGTLDTFNIPQAVTLPIIASIALIGAIITALTRKFFSKD